VVLGKTPKEALALVDQSFFIRYKDKDTSSWDDLGDAAILSGVAKIFQPGSVVATIAWKVRKSIADGQ